MFSPEITVTLSKNLVRFVKKHETIELKPEVYLDHSSPPRVLSVGSLPIEQVAHRAVHLFDGKDCDEDKVLVLEAFFRFGFQKLLGGGLRLPPKVLFDVAPEIVAQFGGYHRIVLHHCAKMAGAYSTSYDKQYGRA